MRLLHVPQIHKGQQKEHYQGECGSTHVDSCVGHSLWKRVTGVSVASIRQVTMGFVTMHNIIMQISHEFVTSLLQYQDFFTLIGSHSHLMAISEAKSTLLMLTEFFSNYTSTSVSVTFI